MRYLFPHRRTPGGILKLEVIDPRAGDYEVLSDKYFLTMSPVRDEVELRLGELRMGDVSVKVVDFDRKFRDTIFNVTASEFVRFKALYQDRLLRFIRPRGVDMNGSPEYMYSASPDFNMNGPEEVTNPGFDSGTSGWTLNTTSAGSAAHVHSGAKALEDTGGGTPVYNEYVFPSDCMFQVTAEVWVYIQSYTSGTIKMELLDNSNNVLATKSAITGTIGSWQKLVINLDAILVRKIRLHNTGTAVVYWDDVSVTRAWDFTIAAWVWPYALTAQSLVTKHDGGSNAYTIRMGASGAYAEFYSSALGATTPDKAMTAGVFQLVVATFNRDGLMSISVNGGTPGTIDISGLGNPNNATNLTLGRFSASATEFFSGVMGEVMIIKGWAADAITIADWYANGIQARSDTIGFWRFQKPMSLDDDSSGLNHSLTLVSIDSNDSVEDGTNGDFAPFKQRAQANESLFYGDVSLRGVTQDEKKDTVDFSVFPPTKRLEEIHVSDLYTWLQQNGYEWSKRIEYRAQGVVFPPGIVYIGKAIRIVDVLLGMARLAGITSLTLQHLWKFRNVTYDTIEVGLDDLWVITQGYEGSGVIGNMFDPDLSRSPLSFVRLGDCLSLLKDLQLSFFALSGVSYIPDTDTTEMKFTQRGYNSIAVEPDGRLLELAVQYEITPGVRISTRYDDDLGDFVLDRGAGDTGADSFQFELALKTWDTDFNTRGPDYSYLYGGFFSDAVRGELQRAKRIACHGWPLNGAFKALLSYALADAYWDGHGGRKKFYAKTHHGLTATKAGISSTSNLRTLEIHDFQYRDRNVRTEFQATELDVLKNESKLTTLVRSEQ